MKLVMMGTGSFAEPTFTALLNSPHQVVGLVTQRTVLDALEIRFPTLRGTIRDHVTQKRRPMLRFFACAADLSDERPDAVLPDAVASGAEPYFVVGAIAGG